MKKYLTKKDTQYLFELIKKLVEQFYSQKPSTNSSGCYGLREVKSHVKA